MKTKTIAVLLSLCILCMGGGGCSKPPEKVFVDRGGEEQSQSTKEHLEQLEGELEVYKKINVQKDHNYSQMQTEHKTNYKKMVDKYNELLDSKWEWRWYYTPGAIIVGTLVIGIPTYYAINNYRKYKAMTVINQDNWNANAADRLHCNAAQSALNFSITERDTLRKQARQSSDLLDEKQIELDTKEVQLRKANFNVRKNQKLVDVLRTIPFINLRNEAVSVDPKAVKITIVAGSKRNIPTHEVMPDGLIFMRLGTSPKIYALNAKEIPSNSPVLMQTYSSQYDY